ncbi:glycosyltransferase [candidate division CSSED10-310 bacterium]|uniref:Glycosyltransferase n=1 Tax=candidate division CSSED10-310 bacterium TaxID=2855610 RepID=A0ABV6Z099_UNCC1
MVANILYRGPLERSRLSFLAESTAQAYGDTKLIWLCSRRLTRFMVEHFQSFMVRNPWIKDWEIVAGKSLEAPLSIANLRNVLKQPDAPLVAIGVTVPLYARFCVRGSFIWCINGIPEEALINRTNLLKSLYVKLLWRLASHSCYPDLIVTVSNPMSTFISERCQTRKILAVPNCVDVNLFKPEKTFPRRFMTYLGTGAPWQGLDYLSRVWIELYRLDHNLRFRVISRDERTRILSNDLPPEAIEFHAVEEPNEVAQLLWESEAGFVLRSPHLINRVSFPTKFAEYLAAGAYVVTTDMRWDPSDIVKKTGCGILSSPDLDPKSVAQSVIDFRNNGATKKDISQHCLSATRLLDRRHWVAHLASYMPQ